MQFSIGETLAHADLVAVGHREINAPRNSLRAHLVLLRAIHVATVSVTMNPHAVTRGNCWTNRKTLKFNRFNRSHILARFGQWWNIGQLTESDPIPESLESRGAIGGAKPSQRQSTPVSV